MGRGDEAARRALALVGRPFRPQGRGEDGGGLDCVGLVLAAHGLMAEEFRSDYRLSGAHQDEIMAAMAPRFRRVFGCDRRPGDVLLLRCGTSQFHLAVATEEGFVHADAARRRAVHTPGAPRWPLIGRFRARRLATKKKA